MSIHEIGHLSSRPRIYKRLNWLQRLCDRWDCRPWELAVILFSLAYLVAQIARAKAAGWL